MSKDKYLYGFKHVETGLFKDSYRTIRGKVKTACFRTIGNATKALSMQNFANKFDVSRMVKLHSEGEDV
jgi:hypothetical protein